MCGCEKEKKKAIEICILKAIHNAKAGMRIRIRSYPLVFGPPDPDSLHFSLDLNPDLILPVTTDL